VLWRLPDLLGNYMLEAFGACTAPLLSLVLADQLALGAYQRTWFELKNLGRAPLLLEQDGLALVRSDLAAHPLLRWLRPAPGGGLRRQLRAAAVWYDALLSPEDAPWLQRYGAPLRSALAGLLALLTPLLWWGSASAAWLPARTAQLAGIALAAVALGTLAVGQLQTTARRQAIQDYFTTYLDNPL
jgi:hypothetical protein